MAEPIEVTPSYTDQAGKKSTNTLYITEGLTLIQIIEGLQTLVLFIDDVVGALINGIDFTISVDLSGLTGNVTAATADVEEVGEFISRTVAGRDVTLNLPCINDTTSPPGSDDLDPTDTNIGAIISMLEDGLAVTGGTIIPCDVDGNDLVQVVTSRERVRNSGSRG